MPAADLESVTDLSVRLLPADPRDMVPSAVRWAQAVEAAVQAVPDVELRRTSRPTLLAVVWVLAAAADDENRVSVELTVQLLAREADLGERVWQQRTAWLRHRGWLYRGPDRARDE